MGALYLTLTGASGFLAALLEDELKSLLKLGMTGEEREEEKEGEDRERQHTRTDMQTQAVAAAVLDLTGEQLGGQWVTSQTRFMPPPCLATTRDQAEIEMSNHCECCKCAINMEVKK